MTVNRKYCCNSNSYGWNTHTGWTNTSKPWFSVNLQYNIGQGTTIMSVSWNFFFQCTQHRFKRYFGQTARGFCITIIRRLTLHLFFVTISPKTQRISFHNHHIRLIWLRVTSGYSPNSKDHSEDTVFTRFKRYKPNRRRLWRQFRKSNLTSVSTIGKTFDISALY